MNSAICRMQYLDKYQTQILEWLREFPDLTAAQVCDWLREYYREDVSERTVSRYVKQLREEYGLKKSVAPREYEAVPELPMGQQMQVDFGQKVMPNVDGGQTKVYVAAFVLSRSRYKYAQEQNRPFTSVDLVRICHDCLDTGSHPFVFSYAAQSEHLQGIAIPFSLTRISSVGVLCCASNW